jgi:hypothetical protein
MKNFDAEKFQSSLRQIPRDTVFLFDEVDDMLDSWESLVIGAIDSHCPMRDKRVAQINQAPWMSKSILNQLRHRDKCLKTARISNSPDAWSKYREERNKSVSLLRSTKSDYYSKTFDKNKNNSRNMWKSIKSLTGSSKSSKQVKTLSDGVFTIEDPKLMASKFNKHFSSIAKRLRSSLPNITFNFDQLIYFVKSRKDPEASFAIPSITKIQVVDSLLKINPHKATGIDKISASLLRIAAPVIAPSVMRLINHSFKTGVFPQRWKTAKVTPLFKGGESGDVSNYRPISILPTLSKVIERHVHDSLYSYLTVNDLIYSKQSGFRKRHNTETALIQIIDELHVT